MVETFSIFPFFPLDWIHGYVIFLHWLAGAVALVLILGFCIRIASAVAFVMLAAFLIANSLFLSFGIPCACMGDILQVLPYAIAFDVLLLGMAIWVFVMGERIKLYDILLKGKTI